MMVGFAEYSWNMHISANLATLDNVDIIDHFQLPKSGYIHHDEFYPNYLHLLITLEVMTWLKLC